MVEGLGRCVSYSALRASLDASTPTIVNSSAKPTRNETSKTTVDMSVAFIDP